MFRGGKISLFDKSPAYDDSHPELKDMGSQSRTRSPERFRASLPDFVVRETGYIHYENEFSKKRSIFFS